MAVVNEAVADVAEQVAAEALEVADVARSFDGRAFGLGLLGGVVIGGVACGLIVERKLRTKYETLAEEEISQMREHFHARAVAQEGKPALDGLVEDLGYVPAAGQTAPLTGNPLRDGKPEPGAPNTTVEAESEVKNVFEEAEARTEVTDPDADWDYDTERSQRNAGVPYVIHKDEQEEMGFTTTTFTYYEGDDVVCDERDKIIDNRDEILGNAFVDKFGHGSGDPNVVYIRNEELAAEIEVCRSPNSYAEEVHGFKHADEPRRLRRSSPDDE